jgi:hypothetical protein
MVVAAVVVVLALAGGLLLLARIGDGDDFTSPTRPPAGTEAQDPQLTALAQECYEGSMAACDDLYLRTPRGSELERYGDTCGGRMPDPRRRYCADAIDDPILPD